jgi:hypothetical protein
MRKFLFAALLAFSLSSVGLAQDDEGHSDIEFGFETDVMGNVDSSAVEIEAEEFNVDNIAIFEGEFENLDFSGTNPDLFTDNPGFITPLNEGLQVNVGDSVSIRFLDASSLPTVGAGYVNFFDPTMSGLGIQEFGSIEVSNSGGDSITLDSSTDSDQSIFLALGDDGTGQSNPPGGEDPEDLAPGEIHTHLQFDLQDEGSTPPGALGLLAQFDITLASDGSTVVSSNPFFLILNAGLNDTVFEGQAVPAFGVTAIPEPASGTLIFGVAGAIFLRRRKRLA